MCLAGISADSAPGCSVGEEGGQCAGPGLDDGLERPVIELHSPQPGEQVVGGHVTIVWEVTYFDIVQGYVEILVNDQVVNTPLPIEPASGTFLEPELILDGQFGSNVPLEDGPHRIHAHLMDLRGRLLASAAVNISVSRAPVRPLPNYTLDGNAQSWSTLLNMAVANREPLRDVFSNFINTWPPPGHCGHGIRPVEGFPPVDSYAHRPMVVYVCPPDKCGGSLDWMRWQEDAAAACGSRCLWVDRLPCHSYADVVLLSCYAAPPPGFGKWPHQAWAYLCMEADTRRRMLSDNLLRHLDIVANYRLHPDFPRLDAVVPTAAEPPWHVTVTYAPGNVALFVAPETDPHAQRPHLAAYLVSNCGRPRDLYISRLLEVLGDEVHSFGRCFNNRPFPPAKEHGSHTLAVLKGEHCGCVKTDVCVRTLAVINGCVVCVCRGGRGGRVSLYVGVRACVPIECSFCVYVCALFRKHPLQVPVGPRPHVCPAPSLFPSPSHALSVSPSLPLPLSTSPGTTACTCTKLQVANTT